MTVLRSLFERRGSVEDPRYPLTSTNLTELLEAGYANEAGVSVSESTAWQMPAVWRAVNLIAGTSASLPLHTYRGLTKKRVVVDLLDNPHPDMTPFELWELSYVYRLLWGNSYSYKVRNGSSVIRELLPLPPSSIKVGRVSPEQGFPGRKVYEFTDADGQTHSLTDFEILHVPGIGYDGVCGVSPIRIARQSVAMALAAEQYGARLFGSGSLMSGILQTEQRLEDQQAQELKRRWKEQIGGLKKAHEIIALGSGAKFQPVTMPNSDAQFIESRRFQVSEIARWFGIPPHMLFDTEKSTSWGTGIEQQGIGFVVYTLRPWLTRTEQRVTRELCPANTYAKYAVEGLLRGDSAARAAFYRTMRETGAFNVDTILDLEDMEPLPNGAGQEHLRPLNMAPLDVSPERINAVAALIRAGFEADAACEAVGLPPIAHTGQLPVTVQPDEEPSPNEDSAPPADD